MSRTVPGSITSGVTWDFFRGSLRQNHVPWARLSLWKWVPGISAGVKAAGAFGWRPATLEVLKVEKIRGLNLLGTPRPVAGYLYLYLHNWLLVNSELERMWKEAVLPYCEVAFCPGNSLEGLRNSTWNLNRKTGVWAETERDLWITTESYVHWTVTFCLQRCSDTESEEAYSDWC
jgi:hypothetical protein